ncbi:MAG: NAD(P)H-binding protein [Pseudomonadota bacterium]
MGSQQQRVLLAGASGYVGRAVASELVSRGHQVVAVVREAIDLRGADVRVGEVTDLASLERAVGNTPIDSVVSCIASRSGVPDDAWQVDYEANRNMLEVASSAGVRHFLLLSAICVQKPRLAFQHAKLAFEAELRESPLEYTIVRPTAFFKSLSGQIERVRDGKPFLTFGDGTTTACKPIGEADLAAFMADCLDDPAARNRILPIGGPGEAVTPQQQGELLFELLNQTPQFRRVPPGIFRFALGLLAPIGLLLPAARKKAELARIGHYYATESMLAWDAENERYDADATPSTGRETLRDFYTRVLADGLDEHKLGDHKVF